MRKITEILRLRAQGMSVADIATSAGTGRTTVYEYLARAESAGIGWPLPDGLNEETLERRLLAPSAELAARRPVPEWRALHKELKKKHVTLRLVWLEWRAENPDGWGYSQFCWHYGQWLAGQDVVMRLSYPAGERMFVDFSGDRGGWVDPDSGEVVEAEVFVAVLGCSGLLYCEATRGQDSASWLSAHVRTWEFYGGVMAATTPDNLRAGVSKACTYDPELNPPTPSWPATIPPPCCPPGSERRGIIPGTWLSRVVVTVSVCRGRSAVIPRDNRSQTYVACLCWFSLGGMGNGCLCQRRGRAGRFSGRRGRVFAIDAVAVPVGVVAG